MPTATRTFRVFVSSTLEDLKEERNALQREVFPTLAKLCEEHGARFQAIDLRWGVGDEARFDQKTIEVCDLWTSVCRAMVRLTAPAVVAAVTLTPRQIVVGTSIGEILIFDIRGLQP